MAFLYLLRSRDDEFYDWLSDATTIVFPDVFREEQTAGDHLLVVLHRIYSLVADQGPVYSRLEKIAAKLEQRIAKQVDIPEPCALLTKVQLVVGDPDSLISISLLQGMYAYFFCRSTLLEGFQRCKFGNIEYVTEHRQATTQACKTKERTMFVCDYMSGIYVGTFKHFLAFRFPRAFQALVQDDGTQAPVAYYLERLKLAAVGWLPKVKTITVTLRESTAVGSISFVPLDDASVKLASEDTEVVIDLQADKLNLRAATLLRVSETEPSGSRSRFMFRGEGSHPDANDQTYDQPQRRRRRLNQQGTRSAVPHHRGYLIIRAHS